MDNTVSGAGIIHDKPYFLKAIISDGERPKVVFRSDYSDDLEITVDDAGRMTFTAGSRQTD